MKLIENFDSSQDAEEISSKLRKKGIMTFISSQNSHRISRYRSGATTVGLWIVLPEQYADAIAVLKNKNHYVSKPLSQNEMYELEKHGFNKSSGTIIAWLVSTSLILSVLAVAALIYINGSTTNA